MTATGGLTGAAQQGIAVDAGWLRGPELLGLHLATRHQHCSRATEFQSRYLTPVPVYSPSCVVSQMRCVWVGMRRTTPCNKRVPPALTAFAPGNTARGASRVGTLGR
jgi:hypothetical protein